MARIEWNGSTGQLTTDANWVGGTAPSTSDYAIFDRGSQNVDPSLGQIDEVLGIEVHPGYTGTIGGSGNEMIMTADNYLLHLGVAEMWWKDNDEVSNTATAEIVICCQNPGVVVHLGAESTGGDPSLDNVAIYRGTVTLDGDHDNITILDVGYVSNINTDAIVTINNASVTISDLIMSGGTVELNETATRATVYNGILNVPRGTSGTTTALIQHGGRVNHLAGNTIADLRVSAGYCDLGTEGLKTVTRSIFGPTSRVVNTASCTFTNSTVDLRDQVDK